MVLQLTIVSAEGASTPVAPTTSVFATTNTPNPTPTPQTSSSVPVDSTSSPTSTPQSKYAVCVVGFAVLLVQEMLVFGRCVLDVHLVVCGIFICCCARTDSS